MKAEPRWIGKKALLLLHERSLAEFGGARGLRDEGLLDAALARPQNLLAYNSASTIAALAASYAYGIARNHAFVDGNKRAAFLSIGLFLGLNGHRLAAGQVNALQTIFAFADGTLDEPGLSAWIEEHMERQEP
jgi:death on curing protein